MRLKYVAFLPITTRPRGSSGKCGFGWSFAHGPASSSPVPKLRRLMSALPPGAEAALSAQRRVLPRSCDRHSKLS